MNITVSLLELGESVAEATVTRWLKDVGEAVAAGEPLLEVSTDKVETEIPAPAAGTLLDHRVAADDVVTIGVVLATIGQADAADDGDAPAPVTPARRTGRRCVRARGRSRSSDAGFARGRRVRHGSGSRVGGAALDAVPVGAGDRRAGARHHGPAASAAPDHRRADDGVAGDIGPAHHGPRGRHDQDREVACRAEFERCEGVKATFLPFIARAAVEALRAFPAMNASISDDGRSVTYHDGVHLAIAVDTPRGLLVSVIRDAHALGLVGLAHRIADVAERTRGNTISAGELSGGTFTISNIGSAGALFDTPIINQPQVAILATGALYRRPAVVTGPDGTDQFGARSFCYLPMTYDHRLVDGAAAGRFTSAVRRRLEEAAFDGELG